MEMSDPPVLTPEQQRCSHILASKMSDGKYFCPSCRAVSKIDFKFLPMMGMFWSMYK